MSLSLLSTAMDVTYAPSSALTTYSLLELPPELIESLSRETLEIKGNPTDETVLCTSTKTYAVRAIRNSNALLLCLPLTRKGQISCVTTLHRMPLLLSSFLYEGNIQRHWMSP